MKAKYLAMALMVLVGTWGCNKTVYETAEVSHISSSEGAMTVRALGYGKPEKEAMADAERQAFETLLFKGIPNTQQKNAMVEDPTSARSKHASYFEKFFEEGGYKAFVMSSYTSGSYVRDRVRGDRIAVDVKINLHSLRRDLEKNGVIRKFGF